jgi:hypothetical protein
VSVVAVRAFHTLVPFLAFDRQCGDRPGLETTDRDRLARLLTITVAILFDAAQRIVDLLDQLALAVAGAQLQGMVRLQRRAVGDVCRC